MLRIVVRIDCLVAACRWLLLVVCLFGRFRMLRLIARGRWVSMKVSVSCSRSPFSSRGKHDDVTCRPSPPPPPHGACTSKNYSTVWDFTAHLTETRYETKHGRRIFHYLTTTMQRHHCRRRIFLLDGRYTVPGHLVVHRLSPTTHVRTHAQCNQMEDEVYSCLADMLNEDEEHCLLERPSWDTAAPDETSGASPPPPTAADKTASADSEEDPGGEEWSADGVAAEGDGGSGIVGGGDGGSASASASASGAGLKVASQVRGGVSFHGRAINHVLFCFVVPSWCFIRRVCVF